MYKLTFEGNQFKFANIVPLRYSGGKVSYSSRHDYEISQFEPDLQNRFPAKDAFPLTFHRGR